MVSLRVAPRLMLSTISPFLTNAGGTRVARIDFDGDIRSQSVVGAPLADGADEIGLRGLLGHGERILHAGRTRKSPEAIERIGVPNACYTLKSANPERLGCRDRNSPSIALAWIPGLAEPALRQEQALSEVEGSPGMTQSSSSRHFGFAQDKLRPGPKFFATAPTQVQLGSRVSSCALARDDAAVSDRCDLTRLALGQLLWH